MSDVSVTLTTVTEAIAAIAALGTAASGLVDATKAFNGGISNIGFKRIETALTPFRNALVAAESDWTDTIRAAWINGVAKEDQKSAAKSLIRLGLSSANAARMAPAGHVDPVALTDVMQSIENGTALAPDQVNLLGRFNGAIDAAMDGGFEQADQQYRNASKAWAGLAAVLLAIGGGALMDGATTLNGFGTYLGGSHFWEAVLVGLVAVPLAPVAKNLTSSLQAAVTAMKSVQP
jgi:hypothetical protein